MSAKPTLLVTGASGNMGRRILELLLETETGPVIATTRTPEKLQKFSERGVMVRPASFDDPASLRTAFEGADRLLVISTDALGEPGRRINQHRAAVKAAGDAGVKHILYTSISNPTPDTPVILAADHRATEEAIMATTMGWTFLRNNIYTETLLFALAQAVQTGQLFSAAGDGKTAYVTREDCARAAAAALASSFDGHRALDITGPEALSQADLARITTELTGRQVTYIPLDLDVRIQGMVTAGLPRPAAEVYASFDAGMAQGYFSGVSTAFEELTGQKPDSVAEFLAAHRDTLLRGPAAH